jgi:hypothetical protein
LPESEFGKFDIIKYVQAATKIGFLVLLDDKAKWFCCFRRNEILTLDAIILTLVLPPGFVERFFFPLFDFRVLLQTHKGYFRLPAATLTADL